MGNPSWFHRNDADNIQLIHNFIATLPRLGPELGLSGEQISSCVSDLTYLIWVIMVWHPAMSRFAKANTIYKSQALRRGNAAEMPLPTPPLFAEAPPPRPNGILDRYFTLVAQIKASPNYRDELHGRELQIVTPVGTSSSGNHPYPTFTLRLLEGPNHKVVEIPFQKGGHQGVVIQTRYPGQPWTLLAVDNTKPHIDDRPLLDPAVAEIREYQLRFWDKGVANGEWSPVQSIAVTPKLG